MIEVEDIKRVGYSHILNGNEGENQLIITTAWGQDGRSCLVVTEATCDGGVHVLYSSDHRMTRTDLIDDLAPIIEKWIRSGIPPAPQYPMANKIEMVLKRLSTDWYLEEGS